MYRTCINIPKQNQMKKFLRWLHQQIIYAILDKGKVCVHNP